MLCTLPDKYVQTCVTSPPYFGLRDYGVAGQLGLEGSVSEYITGLVKVFREVKRVLRDDGTLWVNIGDSYAGVPIDEMTGTAKCGVDTKAKNLLGVPWRLAFALQDDGWFLRTEVIWNKPNGLPSSVKDRPTRCHEYIFLLTKGGQYFYDQNAIREPDPETGDTLNGANRRSVWTIATQSYTGAHTAVFPTRLPELCIKAGTSAKGACVKCGAPWKRVVEEGRLVSSGRGRSGEIHSNQYRDRYKVELGAGSAGGDTGSGFGKYERRDLGFRPSCKCEEGVCPCVVLDPFTGSGTTLAVARQHLRSYLGIELNEEMYRPLIERRLASANDEASLRGGFEEMLDLCE